MLTQCVCVCVCVCVHCVSFFVQSAILLWDSGCFESQWCVFFLLTSQPLSFLPFFCFYSERKMQVGYLPSLSSVFLWERDAGLVISPLWGWGAVEWTSEDWESEREVQKKGLVLSSSEIASAAAIASWHRHGIWGNNCKQGNVLAFSLSYSSLSLSFSEITAKRKIEQADSMLLFCSSICGPRCVIVAFSVMGVISV